MKILLVTDLEGVAGVLNFEDWCTPAGRYYEDAKRLLTEEVNAVVDGFFAGGATLVRVIDGHGHGGINPELLDERAELLRGAPTPNTWPFTLDEGFDGMAWVGQHAKVGTHNSHLSHTGTFSVKRYTINGVPVGELGQSGMCAFELGVPIIFAAGEEALAREAEEFAPGVVTCAVKRGCCADGLEDATTEAYAKSKLAAIHVAPKKARKLLREAAQKAAEKLRDNPGSFKTNGVLPPYEIVCALRKYESRPDMPDALYKRHATSYIAALNKPYETEDGEVFKG